MRLNVEQLGVVAAEVNKFDTDLNLSNEQRQILQDFLRQALEQIEEYKAQNLQSSESDLLGMAAKAQCVVHRRMRHFLNDEQNRRWDAKWATSETFLRLTFKRLTLRTKSKKLAS